MCLATLRKTSGVDPEAAPLELGPVRAWKVVRRTLVQRGGKWVKGYYGVVYCTPDYRRGDTLAALAGFLGKTFPSLRTSRLPYPGYLMGFHAFGTLAGARFELECRRDTKKFAIVEVALYDIRAVGQQSAYNSRRMLRCVVGDKMKVVREVK